VLVALTVMLVLLLVLLLLSGFDVWMANSRSNDYSRGNYHHSFREAEYWYTSMDEIALIDLPAMVNTILKLTGAKKIGFVGHSQVMKAIRSL
jgi:lysosomal acid lipase/cholesteryl ester hydrolase